MYMQVQVGHEGHRRMF